MKFHYTLTILDNYFDQYYRHSISKRVHAVEVWRIQEFIVTVQYANEVLALDLLERGSDWLEDLLNLRSCRISLPGSKAVCKSGLSS